MTKEEYAKYDLSNYADEFFSGRNWEARMAINQFAAGMISAIPIPEVEGISAENVTDGILSAFAKTTDGWQMKQCATLDRIAETLGVIKTGLVIRNMMGDQKSINENLKVIDKHAGEVARPAPETIYTMVASMLPTLRLIAGRVGAEQESDTSLKSVLSKPAHLSPGIFQLPAGHKLSDLPHITPDKEPNA